MYGHASAEHRKGRHRSHSNADHMHKHRRSEPSSRAKSSRSHDIRGSGYRIQERKRRRSTLSRSPASRSPICSARRRSRCSRERHSSLSQTSPSRNKTTQDEAQQSKWMDFSTESEVRSEEDRNQRLAAMSNAAALLDRERKGRLEAAERQEADVLRTDQTARERSSNKAEFLFEVNRRAGEQTMEARLRAGCNNLISDID